MKTIKELEAKRIRLKRAGCEGITSSRDCYRDISILKDVVGLIDKVKKGDVILASELKRVIEG